MGTYKALCIHGHFYQPPREDPLTGLVPAEPGAAPYRNWNERIHAECYRPNAELGNFARISFNVGPTLFDWMTTYDPATCARIIEQDQANYQRHGVGNAMAQAYNHTILPLATRADKTTQVRWGIADFIHRYGHRPAGMWLPETAVDTETLQVLVENGIEFTILAPWQAKSPIDPGYSYFVRLPADGRISVLFYDQDLSTRVSFDPGSTANADSFAANLIARQYPPDGKTARLVMIASDGELYGHHQPFRDKFLKHLLNGATSGRGIEMTYPGLWLKQHPPRREAVIAEPTSWSCHHGVTRWMGDCGCTSGAGWKSPLRAALNQLGELINQPYVEFTRQYGLEPWALRDAYIQVILGETNLPDLLWDEFHLTLGADELRRLGLLLKGQFERQRAFTSCGWFFDDFDRIEPRNNVAYAAQAVWLTYQASGVDLTHQALSLLKLVRSPRTGLTGDRVFAGKYARARQRSDSIS
jgi:alpha-amylase/alpha-mannosidase (GH57 family)